MGSGGTEWETADTFDAIRLNQKTRFVGKGIQASNLITSPQTGQMVVSTENDVVSAPPANNTTFLKEKLCTRDSTNANWKTRRALQTDATVTAGTERTTGAQTIDYHRFHRFYTLPTTYKFYIIYEISGTRGIKAGDGVNVTVQAGISIVNQEDPTIESTLLAGITAKRDYTDGSGADFHAYYNHALISDPIPGGSIIGIWMTQWNANPFATTQNLTATELNSGNHNTKQTFSSWQENYASTGAWIAGPTDHAKAWLTIKYYGYN